MACSKEIFSESHGAQWPRSSKSAWDEVDYLDPLQSSSFRPTFGTETSMVALVDNLSRET